MDTSKCLVKPWTLEMQFQLTATGKILQDEMIISELPLVSVAVEDIKYPSAAWSLVNSLLQSPELLSAFYSLDLKVSEFPLDREDKTVLSELAKTHRVPKEIVRKLYFTVGTNHAAYINSDFKILGFAVYPMLSRSNHSCSPNAKYAPGNLGCKEAALIALRDIEPGESITWSYVRGGLFMNSDYKARKLALLHNFQFVCRCDRCLAEMSS